MEEGIVEITAALSGYRPRDEVRRRTSAQIVVNAATVGGGTLVDVRDRK